MKRTNRRGKRQRVCPHQPLEDFYFDSQVSLQQNNCHHKEASKSCASKQEASQEGDSQIEIFLLLSHPFPAPLLGLARAWGSRCIHFLSLFRHHTLRVITRPPRPDYHPLSARGGRGVDHFLRLSSDEAMFTFLIETGLCFLSTPLALPESAAPVPEEGARGRGVAAVGFRSTLHLCGRLPIGKVSGS
jgi:hypothetical protein